MDQTSVRDTDEPQRTAQVRDHSPALSRDPDLADG
jgi:hypothetical protein